MGGRVVSWDSKGPEHVMGHRIEVLYPDLANVPRPVLKVVDSTDQTVGDTVEEVMELIKV